MSANADAPRARRWWLPLLGLAVSAVALWILVATFDVPAAIEMLRGAAPLPLAAIVAVIGMQLFIRTYRWRALLRAAAGAEDLPVRRLIGPLAIGYLANAVLPARLGEPTRALLVARRERLGMPESLSVVLVERVVDVATLALVVLAAAVAVGAPGWVISTAVLAAGAGALVLALLVTGGLAALIASIQRRLGARGGRLATLFGAVHRFLGVVRGRERGGVVALAAAISVAAWLLDGTSYFLVATALDVPLAPAAALVVSGVAVLGTAVPSAPAYIGTFELAASAALTALGAQPEEAVAIAILAHVMTVLPPALAGAVALVLLRGSTRASE